MESKNGKKARNYLICAHSNLMLCSSVKDKAKSPNIPIHQVGYPIIVEKSASLEPSTGATRLLSILMPPGELIDHCILLTETTLRC